MRHLTVLLLVISPLLLFSQDFTKNVGVIELQSIRHNYILDNKDNPTKQIDNKAKHPFEKAFYDKDGRVLRTIYYGDMHNENLQEVDYIHDYTYEGNIRTRTQFRFSKTNNAFYIKEILKTTFNKTGQKLTDSTFYINPDSASFFRLNLGHRSKTFIAYKYLTNPNQRQAIYGVGDSIIQEYDSFGRLKAEKQIWGGKLWWEWDSYFIENQRVGKFQTFYKRDDNYTRNTFDWFNNDSILVLSEIKYPEKPELNKKEVYTLFKNGLKKQTDYYEMNQDETNYILTSFIKHKIKTKVPLTKEVVKNMMNSD